MWTLVAYRSGTDGIEQELLLPIILLIVELFRWNMVVQVVLSLSSSLQHFAYESIKSRPGECIHHECSAHRNSNRPASKCGCNAKEQCAAEAADSD